MSLEDKVQAFAGLLVIGVVVFFVVLISGGKEAVSVEERLAEAETLESKWYEGGTLHGGSGLDWQQATHANKLATSADLLASLWQKDKLSPEVRRPLRNIDDFKPLAEQLVAELDDAFAPEPDQHANRQMFANQGVADSAIMVMALKGWIAL